MCITRSLRVSARLTRPPHHRASARICDEVHKRNLNVKRRIGHSKTGERDGLYAQSVYVLYIPFSACFGCRCRRAPVVVVVVVFAWFLGGLSIIVSD